MTELYGWFSPEMREQCGSVIYLTPEGRELEVTLVSRAPVHETDWEDIRCVGRVTEFVRKGYVHSWDFLDEAMDREMWESYQDDWWSETEYDSY